MKIKKNEKRLSASSSRVVRGTAKTYEPKTIAKPNISAKNKKNSIVFIICIVMIAISLLSTTGIIIFNSRIFSSGIEGELPSDIQTPPALKKKQINILVVGIDHIKAQEGMRAGTLTDVVMVASYDIKNQKINIMQIPRDTYIGNDYATGKINAIYGSKKNGGIQGLANRINQMFDIPIDHYVTLDLDGLSALVDAIGGVQMEVPITFSMNDMTIKKGPQLINGKQAEAIVRERNSYANADLGRIQTQRIFMHATMEKIFTLGKSKIIKLAPTMMKQVRTDFTLTQMLDLYDNVMDGAKNNIQFHDLPIKSARLNGLSMISLKKEEMAELLNTHFRPHSQPVSAQQLKLLELN